LVDSSEFFFNSLAQKHLQMKKRNFVLLIAIHASLAAAAKNDDQIQPSKETQQKTTSQSSNLLSKGYFNIFELLLTTPETKDTTEVNLKVPQKSN
jgi:hypothetical protein